MNSNLTNALKDQKRGNTQKELQISGELGIPLGGSKVIEVPSRKSFVYVRLRNNQSEVIQAFNNQVSPSYNLPVIVEVQNGRYVVIGVDTIRYQNNWISDSPYLPRHASTHSFNVDTGGGGDVVFVYPRQLMPAIVFPSGSSGGPNAIVGPYAMQGVDGDWIHIGNTGTQDITPYKPTDSNALMVLVYLDWTTGNPGIIVNSGSSFSNTITGTAEITPYFPTIPDPNYIPLAGVRLASGTSIINWDNIYDARQWIHGRTTGSSGGGGGADGNDFGVYVLDEGTPLGTGSWLNFTGDNIEATISGTTVNIFSTGTAHFVQDEGVLLGPFGTLNFVGDNVDVSISGSVARIFVTGSIGGGGGSSGTILVWDDGVPQGTATVLDVQGDTSVTISGSVARIYSSGTPSAGGGCGTYLRVAQPVPLQSVTGIFWKVPDEVFASGSLSVYNNGQLLFPSIDYVEHIFVSGTFQYLDVPATGTYNLVQYGVPCTPQTYTPTGTGADTTYYLVDSDSELLVDSDSVQLTDSDG